MSLAAASKKIWTILDVLQWGTSFLETKGFDESRLTVELLLSHVLHATRVHLYTNFDKPLTADELASFKALFQRRLQHEPLQYIVGKTEFMGREFIVDKRVLIPRPETEVLVEQVVRCAQENFAGVPVRILDIGTGSGCIAVSCALMVTSAEVIAFDSSGGAVEVARLNAVKNGVAGRVECFVRDLFAVCEADFDRRFHMIVSNPPYIPKSDFDGLEREIRDFEPPLATTDGADGLNFFRRVARIARNLLEPGGAVIVEHAFNQADAVEDIFRLAGWRRIEGVADYSKNPRCLIARDPR